MKAEFTKEQLTLLDKGFCPYRYNIEKGDIRTIEAICDLDCPLQKGCREITQNYRTQSGKKLFDYKRWKKYHIKYHLDAILFRK